MSRRMDKLSGGIAFNYSLDMTDPETNRPSNCCLSVQMKYLRAVKGCYLFHHFANTDNGTTGNWRQGQEECERLGGYLVEITTEQQQMFLVSNVQNTPHHLTSVLWQVNLAKEEEQHGNTNVWYIGLSDQGHEGRSVESFNEDGIRYWEVRPIL